MRKERLASDTTGLRKSFTWALEIWALELGASHEGRAESLLDNPLYSEADCTMEFGSSESSASTPTAEAFSALRSGQIGLCLVICLDKVKTHLHVS